MRFRSDRRWELRALRMSFSRMVLVALLILEIVWLALAMKVEVYFWKIYALFMTTVYPIVLIYFRSTPKVYEVTSTGIRVNGHLIRWKNFKEVFVKGDALVLKPYYGDVILLPKEFKDVVLRWSGRDSIITSQQGGPSSSQP